MTKNEAHVRDVEPPGTSASGKPARASRSRFRKLSWAVAGAVIGLGAAYGGGRLQTRAQVDELEQRLLEAERNLEAARAEEAAEEAKAKELEARRQIHRAVIEFDQNNFGVAERHLRAAAARLTADEPEMKALAAALRTLELSPTFDLASQRAAMLQLASKFDTLRPPPPAAP